MLGLRFIRTQEYDRLLQEIAFWRQAFDNERTRGDRLIDQVVQSAGQPPVSNEGITAMEQFKERVGKEAEELAALDEELELLPSILGDLLPSEEQDEKKAN